jgi:ribosomal protein L11 methyltransferase
MIEGSLARLTFHNETDYSINTLPMQAPAHFLQPDSILYIYYIEGKIPPQHRYPGDIFLGNWEEDGFSFLFFHHPARKHVDAILKAHPHLTLLDTYEMTYEQWQGGEIEPTRIGQFLLTPPWDKAVPEPETSTIVLDPGVVFGNGTHPTTQDCLEAIDLICMGKKVHTMLDLGTGTGILALAATKLGCKKALAVDCNFLAAKTAWKNVLLNDMNEQILVIQGRAEDFTVFPSDLLVANIHYDVMKKIVRSPGFLRQKWFLLSGLLRSQANEIEQFLARQPVIIIKKWNQSGIWTTFLGITCIN